MCYRSCIDTCDAPKQYVRSSSLSSQNSLNGPNSYGSDQAVERLPCVDTKQQQQEQQQQQQEQQQKQQQYSSSNRGSSRPAARYLLSCCYVGLVLCL